jgi:ribonuclease H / adenosylcobalamin/alpha-ribazole phosphatase
MLLLVLCSSSGPFGRGRGTAREPEQHWNVEAQTGSLHVCSKLSFDAGVTATILLIRHAAHVELGKTLTGRRENVSLSRDGLDQATIVADLLGVEPLDAVYSSPRERAFYTAREIAEPHEHEVTITEALDEVDFGDWTGRAFDDLEGDPLWDEWNEARSRARPPGGEAMGEAVARAVKALEAIAADWPDGTVAAVSHCDIIRGVIAHYLGLPLDNLLRFDIDPASVSRLKVGSWGARVMSVNERLYQ